VTRAEECCPALIDDSDPRRCPVSGTIGTRVDLVTVKALLSMAALHRLEGRGYCFCPEPSCDVVYFDRAAASVFGKQDLSVRVGLKETEDPIPVCYCFGFTVADLRNDIDSRGVTDVPALITAEVKAGHCACEVKNPEGSCCLGNVSQAIERLREVRGNPRAFLTG
jgi:Zinc binding domain